MDLAKKSDSKVLKGKTPMSSKNKELDWFVFENRVREIIKDIVDPMANKTTDNHEELIDLKKRNEMLKRKVDEMEFVLHKSQH